ncbi:MAG: phosphate/phosphite/phosphonate ABC transporter substrate-binding protein [Desulfitobacteriaceae bacterium]
MSQKKKLCRLRLAIGLVTIMALLFVSGCTSTEHAVPLTVPASEPLVQAKMPAASSEYVFGFDRRMDPAEDVRMYAPFLRYLEKATGLRFRLQSLAPEENLIDALGTGQVSLAAIGTLSYLQAHQKYGVKAIARGVTEQGKAEYQALIVTAPGSGIRSLADLKGKTFAFGADTSTQGHLIPLILLKRAGINLTDLAGYTFTGSHFETANAVMSGRYAAGGIQDTLGRELANKGLVRIIAQSEEFPSSTISVSPALPQDVVEKIQQALLEFQPLGKDKELLYHWEQTEMPRGFVSTDDNAFAEVRVWAQKLGLLQAGGGK